MSERYGDWIQTYTGRKFWPLDPRPEDICIEDIAHALSNTCRFTGHCKQFYSVAEHSYRVSSLCEPQYALHGLLHDASEAYIADVSSPVKHADEMATYQKIEESIQRAVYRRFGVDQHQYEWRIHAADKAMLGAESRDLMRPLHPDGWAEYLAVADPGTVQPFTSPEWAEEWFLARFHELYKGD